jgi:hypothetical protein
MRRLALSTLLLSLLSGTLAIIVLSALAQSPSNCFISLVPMARSDIKTLLGGRLAKRVSVWSVYVTNVSAQSAAISESAVIREVPQIRPIDHVTMGLLVANAAQNNLLQRGVRLAGDGSAATAFLGTGKIIAMTPRLNMFLTAGGFVFPYVASRLSGIEIPMVANFTTLAWSSPVEVGSGNAASTHVFSDLWTGSMDPITFTIDTSKAPMVRSLK